MEVKSGLRSNTNLTRFHGETCCASIRDSCDMSKLRQKNNASEVKRSDQRRQGNHRHRRHQLGRFFIALTHASLTHILSKKKTKPQEH